MKSLFIFALCGITCCLAVQACSKDEVQKCKEPDDKYLSEEDKLNRDCRYINCLLQITDRCGVDIIEEYFGRAFPILAYKNISEAFCAKTRMRKKYLENIECIKRATTVGAGKDVVRKCFALKDCKNKFCKNDVIFEPDWIIEKNKCYYVAIARKRCAVRYVKSVCGFDAGLVYDISSLPMTDPYSCRFESGRFEHNDFLL